VIALEHYRKMLKTATDPVQRRMIEKLVYRSARAMTAHSAGKGSSP